MTNHEGETQSADLYGELFDITAAITVTDTETGQTRLSDEPGTLELHQLTRRSYIFEKGLSVEEYGRLEAIAYEDVTKMRRELGDISIQSFDL